MNKEKGKYGFSHGSRSRCCSLAKKKWKKKSKGNEERNEEKEEEKAVILSKLRHIINIDELVKNSGYENHKILKRNVKVPLRIESPLLWYYSTLQVPKGFDLIIVLFIVIYVRPTRDRMCWNVQSIFIWRSHILFETLLIWIDSKDFIVFCILYSITLIR